MAEERMRTIFNHINPQSSPSMQAMGVQNQLKVFPDKSKPEEPQKSSKMMKFRYTLNNRKLSQAQRQFYEENGFIVIPKLVPVSCLEQYRQRFQDISEGRVEIPRLLVMKDVTFRKSIPNERNVNKLQDLFYDEVLFAFCHLPQIVDYVECFCGPNIKAIHTMLINKPPDSGSLTSRHPLHQDLHYFPVRPADKIVCAWTAMEKVSRANGCLVAIPGSHKGDLLQHDYPDWEGGVNKLFHGISGLGQDKMDKRVYLEMDAGDTVFFHPILIHGSGANRTEGFRKAISCHYAASECDYIDVIGTSQENISNEIMEASKRRGDKFVDVKEFWRDRARLIRGKEFTL